MLAKEKKIQVNVSYAIGELEQRSSSKQRAAAAPKQFCVQQVYFPLGFSGLVLVRAMFCVKNPQPVTIIFHVHNGAT
jgi:hypothetical protein